MNGNGVLCSTSLLCYTMRHSFVCLIIENDISESGQVERKGLTTIITSQPFSVCWKGRKHYCFVVPYVTYWKSLAIARSRRAQFVAGLSNQVSSNLDGEAIVYSLTIAMILNASL